MQGAQSAMRNLFTRLFRRSPELVFFDDLTSSHFERHEIWLDVHLNEFGDARFQDVEDEAFRPWNRCYPADRDFPGLVSARFAIATGRSFSGYVTNTDCNPANDIDPLFADYPELFGSKGVIAFWHGVVYQFGRKSLDADIAQLENDTGLQLDEIFPIQYATVPTAWTAPIVGRIDGFGYYSAESTIGKFPVIAD